MTKQLIKMPRDEENQDPTSWAKQPNITRMIDVNPHHEKEEGK
jgi:hypothetical protein